MRATRILWAATAVTSAAVLTACSPSTTAGHETRTPAGATSAPAAPSSSPATAGTPSATVAAKRIHVKLLEDDSAGPQTYGVGMPIVAYFSGRITQAKDFSKATTVTLNGRPNAGSWYFQDSKMIKGYPLEAHYRPAVVPGAANAYWPADAAISMSMKVADVPAGTNPAGNPLVFDNDLTLQMRTGAAHISTVDCRTETMTVTSNGAVVKRVPTSCGAVKTPTHTGTKIVMQKGEAEPGTSGLRPDGAVRMIGTSAADPYDSIVPWAVRITQAGEYVHAARWNTANIGRHSSSNGCTNLTTADAKWFYGFARIGDVLTYSETGGSQLAPWDGFGDWNVPASTWATGGAVPTT